MVNIKKRYQTIRGYVLIESLLALGLSALITVYFLDGLNQFISNKQLLISQVTILRALQERKNQLEIAKDDFEIINDEKPEIKVSADDWQKIRILSIEGAETITFKILE
ncbi:MULTISPECIES: hypothetical protein [unclassified Enterococcus]|uniref:hypothetical protein n=1 Tax=unclassified Enterococcus TaxID=2608891 RepID=UPI001555CB58|nr:MULTISPECIES: hypothetical protein [unclassified Enterococcus]MBS7577270.1 hypothetical protein [Enterococcus sp. MMGLQ5-2]MBS7584637.1 hypothetical protein [Enterococcus sp. MMGLQ5-1]NPD12492.1 hypothetical protein [Enterococcus sp. MMGLQ5-1]NPD37104.1 hypothetical protein [Enterococcus sp. MMGLQ5-2]